MVDDFSTTCLKTVVGLSKIMLHVNYFCSSKSFFGKMIFTEILRLSQRRLSFSVDIT